MRAMLAVMMVAICLTPLSFFASETASALTNISIELNKFGNGSENITIDFTTPGTDSSNRLSIQTGMNVNTCSMNVRSIAQDPGAVTGPSDITIDFGGDSQIEWKWTGAGVGGLGLQSSFIDSKPSRVYNIPWTGGFNNTPLIRLPKTAHVNSADMNVTFTAMGTQDKILLMYGELSTRNRPANGFPSPVDAAHEVMAAELSCDPIRFNALFFNADGTSRIAGCTASGVPSGFV